MPSLKTTSHPTKSRRKAPSKRVVQGEVFSDKALWTVHHGVLEPTTQATPGETDRLFQVIGEKLPFSSLQAVRRHLVAQRLRLQGVYVAHDSMGCSRYVGRGAIFARLAARKKKYPLELEYYSFYVVQNKNHERFTDKRFWYS